MSTSHLLQCSYGACLTYAREGLDWNYHIGPARLERLGVSNSAVTLVGHRAARSERWSQFRTVDWFCIQSCPTEEQLPSSSALLSDYSSYLSLIHI